MRKTKRLLGSMIGLALLLQVSLPGSVYAQAPYISRAEISDGIYTQSNAVNIAVELSDYSGVASEVYYGVVPTGTYDQTEPTGQSIVEGTGFDIHGHQAVVNKRAQLTIKGLSQDVNYTAYIVAVGQDSSSDLSYTREVRGIVMPGTHKFIDVAAGGSYNPFTIGVKEDGTLSYWGYTYQSVTVPPAGLTGVKAVTTGLTHVVALKTDGTVVAWGGEDYGVLNVPAELKDPATAHVKAISAGDYHTLALREDGTVVAWGYNVYNQSTVPNGLTDVVAIDAGSNFSMALKADGSVVVFGMNPNGGEYNPPQGVKYKAIAGGYSHLVGVKLDGTVDVWGRGRWPESVAVPAGLSDVVAVDSKWDYTVALKSDGTVVTWGSSNGSPLMPVPGELADVTKVSAGFVHNAAILSDNAYFGWGSNSFKQVTGPSHNAYLSSLRMATPSDVVTLTPAFKPDITEYTANIPANETSLSANAMNDDLYLATFPVIYLGNNDVTSTKYNIPLSPGTNVLKAVVTAADGTLKTYTVTLNRSSQGAGTGSGSGSTYTIASLADQTAAPLTEGYASGTQETKTITVTKTGTGDLLNLSAQLSGTHAADFEVMQPTSSTLNSGTPSTSFTVKAKDGLPAGTYEATVTISADNMTSVSFAVTQVVTAATPATVPAAPTNIKAASGNKQATITFTAPTDNGGSPITGYKVTVSPGNTVVTGVSSPITVTGLNNGTGYTFTVQAVNLIGSSAPSAESNKVIPSSGKGGSSGSSSSSTSTSTSINSSSTSSMNVLVNGKLENAGTATTSTLNNQTVITTAVDQQKLENMLATEGQHAVLTIPVSAKSDIVISELNGQMVKSMEDKEAILQIKTESATYTLPAEQINIGSVSSQLGNAVSLADIKVQVEIAAPSDQTMKIVDKASANEGLTLIAPAVEFNVRAIYEDAAVEVSKFDAYVERSIAIPEGVDPNQMTTGVVIEPDGTVRHVPTKLVMADGKYYAAANSLTNSTYAIVSHPVEFSDVTNHWAKSVVNDLGSRFILNGTDNGKFSPDQDITRAEFSAILVRALGLKLEQGPGAFSDVNESAWYSSAVNTAYAYKLISGLEDRTFRPNDKITREQAMVMIARAMALTGLKAERPVQSDADVLHSYNDAASASEWALSSMADSVQSGIVSGRSSMQLAPKEDITRAEVAAIMYRLLQTSELI
ncbi:S-layer homology domain-containing protein [Paenibacillus aurantiacus]|uniref:S-layer homology domain-containing protein n=1 Tax=Paenibacillus aurantiacus TaxID=1936118 RepID=A0ABV5L085_9BACL